MINGIKLLNVVGLTRGRRDGILRMEFTKSIVKVGPTHLKGVWITFERALQIAKNQNITEILYSLFESVQNFYPLPKLAGQTFRLKPKPSSAKKHQRTRSGCYTCRLLRKKCDEGQDCCKACRELGLRCEYQRSLWWNVNNLQKEQKEHIKSIIKRVKKPGKVTYDLMGNPHTIAASDNSLYFPGYDSQQPIHETHDHALPPFYNVNTHSQGFLASLYEDEIRTESQMYVNDIPYHPSPVTLDMTPFMEEQTWGEFQSHPFPYTPMLGSTPLW